ncbi:MAG: hypothetical protein ACLQNG_05670 [Acidimicrobiales bacterium]
MSPYDPQRPLPARTAKMVEDLCELLRERAQPLLEEGEEIQAIFPAKIGLNPGGSMLAGALSTLDRKVVIVATDRAVVVVEARRRYEPTSVTKRLRRETRLGPARTSPLKRAFARVGLDEPTWISSIWRFEVDRADSFLDDVDTGTPAGNDVGGASE